MWFQSVFKSLTSTSAPRRPTRRRPPVSRPRLEALEDRCLLSFSPTADYGVDYLDAMVAADLNGDGQVDLGPVGSGGGPGINALFGNGDGTFHQAQLLGIGTYNSPIVADLNGDANSDQLRISYLDLRVLLDDAYGDGTYLQSQVIVLPTQLAPGAGRYGDQVPTSAALGDLNGDGKLDLVAAGYDEEFIDPQVSDATRQDHYVNVLLGNGDGTFGQATTYYVTSTAYGTNDKLLGVRDFDGDGNSDVLLSGRLFVGNDDGTLQAPRLFNGGRVPDVNADGNLDRLDLEYVGVYHNEIEVPTTRHVRVELGDGGGSFAAPVISDLGTAWTYVASVTYLLADFNADGLPDLAVNEYRLPAGSRAHGVVGVALNDGNWTPPPPAPPTVTIGDVTITEGNTGTRAATFTVTLSAASSQPVSVAYATANGTAVTGSDYQTTTGTLTISAEQTTGMITVQVNGDRLAERTEIFIVNLNSPTNAIIGDGQGEGTILDDESRISISDVTKAEGKKNQTTLFTFTITLSAAYDDPVTMSFRTVNGTATTGDADYIARTGTLTFAPGETTKTITIEVKGDIKKEAHESFFVDLYNNSVNSLFTKNCGFGTILNDD